MTQKNSQNDGTIRLATADSLSAKYPDDQTAAVSVPIRSCFLTRRKCYKVAAISQEFLMFGSVFKEPFNGRIEDRIGEFGRIRWGDDFIGSSVVNYDGRRTLYYVRYVFWAYDWRHDPACATEHAIPRPWPAALQSFPIPPAGGE